MLLSDMSKRRNPLDTASRESAKPWYLLPHNPAAGLLTPADWAALGATFQLTERELEVAVLIFEGRTRTNIARKISAASHGSRTHRTPLPESERQACGRFDHSSLASSPCAQERKRSLNVSRHMFFRICRPRPKRRVVKLFFCSYFFRNRGPAQADASPPLATLRRAAALTGS